MPDNIDNSTTKQSSAEVEISKGGKFWGGLLLIAFTTMAILLVIAYWPNKMPPISDGDDRAWYTNKWFNVTLIQKSDSIDIYENYSLHKIYESVSKELNQVQMETGKNDSSRKKRDTLINELEDSLQKLGTLGANDKKAVPVTENVKKIHLNTILLLLVALIGFLGNMIHIASSFTSFVGNGTFKRSWTLWYFVKPFTAAGLAIVVYFIIRAGFLSYGSGASSVSLYGILSLSALAGLFTDSATLKLKEVFEVIFKPKDDRTGKLEGELKIARITPLTIEKDKESSFIVTGENLDKGNLKLFINDEPISNPEISATAIKFKYALPDSQKDKTEFLFVIKNEKNEVKYQQALALAGSGPAEDEPVG